jgi:hypothetical protein
MIEFRCEKCGNKFQVKDEMQGKRGKCPCGNAIVIPMATVTLEPVDLSFAPTQPSHVLGTLSRIFGFSGQPSQRSVLGTLSRIFGCASLGIGFLGCLLYFVLWVTSPDVAKLSWLIGHDYPGNVKFILPIVLNYLGLFGALAGIVLGIISIYLDKQWRGVVPGIRASALTVVLLLVFWIWAISRNYNNYAR